MSDSEKELDCIEDRPEYVFDPLLTFKTGKDLFIVVDIKKKTLTVYFTLSYHRGHSISAHGACSEPFFAPFCPTLAWQFGVKLTQENFEYDIYLYTSRLQGDFGFDISAVVSVSDFIGVVASEGMEVMDNLIKSDFKPGFGLSKMRFPRSNDRLKWGYFDVCINIMYKRRIEDFESVLKRMVSYRLFIDNQVNSDFTILLDDGRKIGVNKTAMLIQWPHFKLMIEANMVEANSNIMVVSGIEYDVMKALVDFLITGLFDCKNVEFALRLISAAHRYEVQDLIDNCIELIRELITTAHVLDALVLADFLELSELTDICLEFLRVKKRSKGKLILKGLPGYGKFVAYKNHYEIVLKIAEKV